MRPLFPLLFLLSTAAPLFSGETPDAPTVLAETNAAVLYRAAGKELRPLTEEENALLRSTIGKLSNSAPVPVSPASQSTATALLKTYAAPLDLIKQATALPHCDWQHDNSKGLTISPDHLTPLLTFTRLLALQLRLQIAQTDFPAALDTIRQIVTLRQQTASEKPLLVEALVQMAINSLLIHTLANDLSKWPEEHLPRLSELLASPTHASLENTVRTEAAIASRHFEEQMLPELLKLPGNDPDKARAMLTSYLAEIPRIEALFKLPPAQALKEAQTLEKEFKAKEADNPLSAIALPAIVAVTDRLVFDDTLFPAAHRHRHPPRRPRCHRKIPRPHQWQTFCLSEIGRRLYPHLRADRKRK